MSIITPQEYVDAKAVGGGIAVLGLLGYGAFLLATSAVHHVQDKIDAPEKEQVMSLVNDFAKANPVQKPEYGESRRVDFVVNPIKDGTYIRIAQDISTITQEIGQNAKGQAVLKTCNEWSVQSSGPFAKASNGLFKDVSNENARRNANIYEVRKNRSLNCKTEVAYNNF